VLDQPRSGGGVGQISGKRPGVTPGGNDLVGCLPRAFLGAGIVHSDPHPGLAERESNDAPDACTCTCDESYATV
jgi:hypothetical protein